MIDDVYDFEDILNSIYGGILMSLACTIYLVFFGGFLGVSETVKVVLSFKFSNNHNNKFRCKIFTCSNYNCRYSILCSIFKDII